MPSEAVTITPILLHASVPIINGSTRNMISLSRISLSLSLSLFLPPLFLSPNISFNLPIVVCYWETVGRERERKKQHDYTLQIE